MQARFTVVLVVFVAIAAFGGCVVGVQPAEAAGVYGPGCVMRGWPPVNVPHLTIDGRAWAYCHRRPAKRIEITYMIMRFDDATTDSRVPVLRKPVVRTFRDVKTTSKDVSISYRCKPGEWGWYELWAYARVFDPPRTVSNIPWSSVRVRLVCPKPPKRKRSSGLEAPTMSNSTASQGALSLAINSFITLDPVFSTSQKFFIII